MKLFADSPTSTRSKAVWGPKRVITATASLAIAFSVAATGAASAGPAPKTVRPGHPDAFVSQSKMDREVAKRARSLNRLETADVIVMLEPGADLPPNFKVYSHNGELSVIHAYVLDHVPVTALTSLATHVNTHRVNIDKRVNMHDALSSAAVNANAFDAGNGINNSLYSYTGAGVTVAFVDSGITGFQHPDLPDNRLLAFVDFVNGSSVKYDDNGHGTHVAGLINGSGKQSNSKYAGMATGASLVSLKVLNAKGQGSVGNTLRALDWIYKNSARYGIRIVNLSVGATVTESYYTDPLTLAAKTLVDKVITVVAASGNNGKNAAGNPQWGGVTSPANAPWVLTVCAFSTAGTYNVTDDKMADFSSAGPTAVDFAAKPDICAPGVGVVSTAAPGSTLFQAGLLATPSWLLAGTVTSTLGSTTAFLTSSLTGSYPYMPYESLTGTSMSAPLVSGAVALMLQANPSLTPNLIKAILEFTAISKPGVSALRQGAGFMNVAHAVKLASMARLSTATAAIPASWARHVLWGNHMMSGGIINPKANAWRLGVEWGWVKTNGDDGDNIVWGTAGDGDNIVWGTAADGDNIVWGTSNLTSVVWPIFREGK